MGESSTCLMQPSSYTPVLSPTEAIEGNPIHALGQSVSFGRFTSESLSWEKWSTFSHKRYVEEAERYSRPGSVAEKKAFFEAHYKKMAEKKKAEAEAALLEQANGTPGDAPGSVNVTDSYNSTLVNMDLEKVVEQNQEVGTQISDQVPCKEDDENEHEKEQAKSPDVQKSPLKSSVPKSKEDSFATPKSETIVAINSRDKKRSAHKWLKPLNFTPVKELNLLSSTVKRKIDNSRTDGNRAEPSKDCSTPLKTPIMVPSGSLALVTPHSEQRTTKNDNAAESKTGMKRRSLATECSKFLNACKNKLQSPKISTPFRLRTEERAARRREKLEDKFNAENAQNVPPKTKLKIAETESRKWRPTFCFNAGPHPTDRKEMGRAEDPLKQVPAARPRSPKSGRKHETGTAKSVPSVPLQTTSIKNNGSKKLPGKSFQTTSRSRTLENVMRTHENTSPNIQQV
ncbi:protein WVD2-like 7 isoform X2 [Punica granatum]|uniref:Protein WVD2-like 7 isoform X2 n=1 Tax=Punica granatum TaxID=22663 RepID=A0A6P8CHN2_PUNGR|nr:protein WVD2-like 7 isoform X2 [Punica granatum]